MATKTFCDGCGKEIDYTQSKYSIDIQRTVTGAGKSSDYWFRLDDGKQVYLNPNMREVCEECVAVIVAGFASLGKQ